MIRKSCLFLFTLFSVATYTSEPWEAPAIGFQEELDIVHKAARLNFTFRSGWKYEHVLNGFLDRHLESVLAKIKSEVEERAELLQGTAYAASIPKLVQYKTIKRYNYAKHEADKQPAQQNKNLLQSTVGACYKQTRKLESDRIQVQLYRYNIVDNATKIPVDEAGQYLGGVAQRMQLYAKLYNVLSQREGCDCTCSDHYSSDLCYVPALQAELLAGICFSLQVQQKKAAAQGEVIDEEKEFAEQRAMQTLLAKITQEELQNSKNWDYTPPLNKIADYSKHLPFIGSEKHSIQGPCVLSPEYCHSIKYLPRDMTSGVKRVEGHGREDVPVISSRQMWIDCRQTEKYRDEDSFNNDWKNKRIRFSDDDWGYNLFLDIPQVGKHDDFKIIASHWISNETMNKCVFAYKKSYLVPVEGANRNEKKFEYGIGSVDLPSWDTREYGIQFHATYAYRGEEDKFPNGMQKGLHQKSYDAKVDASHFTKTSDEVTAIVYNRYRDEFFYGQGCDFKKVYFGLNEAAASQQPSFHTFDQPIKKIFALDEWTHLILTADNRIYAHYGFNTPNLKKVEDLTLTYIIPVLAKRNIMFERALDNAVRDQSTSDVVQSIILDIAFDDTRKQLALLTPVGVYVVSLAVQIPPQVVDPNSGLTQAQLELQLSPKGPYEYKESEYSFPTLSTPQDINSWQLKLSNMQLIPHESFKYQKYRYDDIDFQNGQIYVMKKGRQHYQGEDPYVLIYPPVLAAT